MRDKSKKFKEEAAPPCRVRVDAPMIAGFVEHYLLDTFDDPAPTPRFHFQLWELMCNVHQHVAIAAPRGHAKSTAGDYTFVLAQTLFGARDFVLLIGATEDLVKPHLRNIRDQLVNNGALVEDFDIKVIKDNETDLIFSVGGKEIYIAARGAEQRIRGLNWNNKRPNLIMCDDIEDDEMVMSKERREKFQDWFQNVVEPIGSRYAIYRVLGTILHEASLLENLLNSREWLSARFRAHADFDDFNEILWPEFHTPASLRAIRQKYIERGNESGYSQEYLSSPIAVADAYFRKEQLVPMEDADYTSSKLYYVTVDFAISKKAKRDFTVMTVGGVDCDGFLCIVDQYVFRGDGLEIIDQMFDIEEMYRPEFWVCENGQILQSVGAFLKQEMVKRNIYLNIETVTPTADKMTRARSIQKRAQAGGVKFNTYADWYKGLEHEMLMFPRGKHDDRVDTLAYLGLYLDRLIDAPTRQEQEDAEDAEAWAESGNIEAGRCTVTGY